MSRAITFTMAIQTSLSTKEVYTYFFVWTTSCLYVLYCLFKYQEILLDENDILKNPNYFQKDWSVTDRPKDMSDLLWRSCKEYFESAFLWLSLHFLIAEILRHKNEFLVPYWYISISIVYTLYKFGYITVLILFIQPSAYVLVLLLGARKMGIWVLSVFFFTIFNLWKISSAFSFTFVSGRKLTMEEYNMIFISLSWMTLRCVSFSFEHVEDDMSKMCCETKRNVCSPNVLNEHHLMTKIFSYCSYFPLMFPGPFILYDTYEMSFSMENRLKLTQRLYSFFKHMTCYMGWYIFIDWMLHFFYLGALQNYAKMFFHHCPFSALCGSGLWMGLFFYLKYVVMYGMSSLLASMDHVAAPPQPRCTARIHLYSEMWKYFDVGLYKFLVKYIYKPLLTTSGKLPISLAKAMPSFICFFFMYLWHGLQINIVIWTFLNYLGITLENIGSAVSRSSHYKLFVFRVLKTEPMRERFNAFICVPMFLMGVCSNIFFNSSYEFGSFFVEKLLNGTFTSYFVTITCLYSCCHISAFLKNVPARTVKENIK